MQPRILVLVAFVVITVLTALAVLGAALGWFPGAHERLVNWGIPAVLGEIVVTVIIFFRTQWAQTLKVNLTFGNSDPTEIELDGPNCTFAIIDAAGNEVKRGTVGPTFGMGGWQIQLPASVQSDQSITLCLKTQAGETWNVRPFLPLVHTQSAVKVI